MKLTFHVDYRTDWGESIYICGNVAAIGDNDPRRGLKMNYAGGERWSATVELPDGVKSVDYNYMVVYDNGSVRHEWGKAHHVDLPRTADSDVYDCWQDMPADKPFYSSAFTECVCNRPSRDRKISPKKNHVFICVEAPMVRPGQSVAICGETPALGAWDPAKAVVMNDHDFPLWTANLTAKDLYSHTQYKFIIIDSSTGGLVAWENGGNRRIGADVVKDDATVVAGLRLNNPMALWKGAGTAIPVFSIRTEDDFGVGDFYDLRQMVDWCAETGQNFLQLLPINDTTMTHTWTDSYPYNANSTFALHPMYLRLSELGELNDPVRRDYYEKLRHELNALSEIDYERVNAAKLTYAREIFAQEGKAVTSTAEFKNFIRRNGEWLRPYAAFCVLRDKYGTPDFTLWEEYSHYTPSVADRVAAENAADVDFVYYLQYNLDKQMREARDYAHSKGVALKGDIPIGISRTSADAWINPRLFNLNSQAGAPPDDFSVLGQNWGFPTYNWEEMSRDGFSWWKARFRKMAEYFDAYRIDHVLGFFRIWQIPMDAIHGLLGIFNPALPFTPDELRYGYDFHINPETQTRPLICDWFIGEFFGEHTDEARSRFLRPLGDGSYELAPGFRTQREVAAYFAGQEKTQANERMCNALLGLIDNVLFIEDPVEKGKYHPRISAQQTFAYRALNDYERWCFDRLYNDFFYHRHNDFWYGKAMWKLPALIDATDMLVCAEDLGMIPACVPAVMERLEILSLEIQRMPKDPNTPFGNTWHYPYFSVCTTSTHDMGGIRQWWEENRAQTQQFYNTVLHENGEAPAYAEPWICDRIVDLHLKSPSMLCILPLQDWLSVNGVIRRKDPREEQINVPANSRHYWRYRMHLTLEDLRANRQFSSYLLSKIRTSGR